MKTIFLLSFFIFSSQNALFGQAEIRVMSYNIRYDITTSNASPWTERHVAISEQIKRYHADIIGMQEVLDHQRTQLLTDLPEFASVGVGRDDGQKAGEYAPIFYKKERFRLLHSGTFWLSPTPDIPSKGWDAALNRICTYAQFVDETLKDTIWVYNTHFDHVGEEARKRSAELILKKIEMSGYEQQAVVVCGDFNLNDDHPTISFVQLHWKDALFEAKELKSNKNRTFNNFDLENEASKRIDYLFTNEKVDILIFETIVERFGISYPSDHFPILAALKIKK